MKPLERTLSRIVSKYGYCEINWPIVKDLANDKDFYNVIEQLSAKKEIYLLENTANTFLNKECYSNYKALESFAITSKRSNKLDVVHKLLRITEYDNIIFDLGGVIVDESDLDVIICDFFDKHIKSGNFNWKNYDEFSDSLIKQNDFRWYDYFYQANYFKIKEQKIIELHQNYSHLVKMYSYSLELLKLLKEKGKNLFLVTGCNSKVLDIRLEMYGLNKMFIDCVTSDKVNDLVDKELYYRYLINNKGINPANSLLITDNYFKDCLPAFINGIECLLFIKGGRKNKKYNSHGVQPNEFHIISNMIYSRRTDIKYIFSNFRQIFDLYISV